MTYSASMVLPEAPARALFDALGDAETAGRTVDLTEAAPGDWRVMVYLDDPDDLPALDAVAAATLGRPVRFDLALLPDADWVARSLAGLGPVRVGRFVVHGPHDRGRIAANFIAVEIPAAEAFGTGHHGTTAGCLEAIGALSRRRQFGRVLDLGTGTGILAIAAARAWRIPVLAVDNDPKAVAAAAGNARRSGLSGLVEVIRSEGFAHRRLRRGAHFDLVLANILAAPLASLAPALARRLAPGGIVVLSGLLPHQRAIVLAAYRNQHLALERSLTRDGWLTMVLRRRKTRGPGPPAPATRRRRGS